jgi:hypothetical protein
VNSLRESASGGQRSGGEDMAAGKGFDHSSYQQPPSRFSVSTLGSLHTGVEDQFRTHPSSRRNSDLDLAQRTEARMRSTKDEPELLQPLTYQAEVFGDITIGYSTIDGNVNPALSPKMNTGDMTRGLPPRERNDRDRDTDRDRDRGGISI